VFWVTGGDGRAVLIFSTITTALHGLLTAVKLVNWLVLMLMGDSSMNMAVMNIVPSLVFPKRVSWCCSGLTTPMGVDGGGRDNCPDRKTEPHGP